MYIAIRNFVAVRTISAEARSSIGQYVRHDSELQTRSTTAIAQLSRCFDEETPPWRFYAKARWFRLETSTFYLRMTEA